jgi:hypothetical protein
MLLRCESLELPMSQLGQKRPKLPRLSAVKSTTEQRVKFVPLRDHLARRPGRQVHPQQWTWLDRF